MKVKELLELLSSINQDLDVVVRNSEDIMESDGYVERYYNDNIISEKDVYITNIYGRDVVVLGE